MGKDLGNPESFQPDLFLKNTWEGYQACVENCQRIFLENFEMLKIAHLEMLASSAKTYPEISSDAFIKPFI